MSSCVVFEKVSFKFLACFGGGLIIDTHRPL
jgi:hypothetical protein